MKPWRPKKKKQAEAEQAPGAAPAPEPRGLFEPTGLTGRQRKPTVALKRVNIRRVHAAMVIPVVGMVLLVLVPLLWSTSDPVRVGVGKHQVLLDREGAPVELALPDGSGQTRQISIGEAIYNPALRLDDRREASRQLGLQRDGESLEALLRASRDDDPEARRLAIYGLVRRLDDLRVQTALAELLREDDVRIARTAASALGTVERGGYLLMDRLQEPDEQGLIHAACLRGLNYTGTPDLIPLLMPFVEANQDQRAKVAAQTIWMICKRTSTPVPDGLPPRVNRR
jgi:hypothetical protein